MPDTLIDEEENYLYAPGEDHVPIITFDSHTANDTTVGRLLTMFFEDLKDSLPGGPAAFQPVRVLDDNYDVKIQKVMPSLFRCIQFTSNNVTLEGGLYEEIYASCRSYHYHALVASIIIAILGIPGATAAAITFLSMDRTPTTFYLSCLSIGNLITLIIWTGFMEITNGDVIAFRELVGTIPLTALSLLSLERFMSLKYPQLKQEYITIRFCKLSVVLSIINFFLMFFIIMGVRHVNKTTYDVTGVILVIFTYVLNFPLTLAFNYLILITLHVVAGNHQHRRTDFYRGTYTVDGSAIKVVIVSTTVYALLNGPIIYVRFAWLTSTDEQREQVKYRSEVFMLHVIAEKASVLFHATTFYIYVLGTKRFSDQFKKMLKKPFFGRMLCALRSDQKSSTDLLQDRRGESGQETPPEPQPQGRDNETNQLTEDQKRCLTVKDSKSVQDINLAPGLASIPSTTV